MLQNLLYFSSQQSLPFPSSLSSLFPSFLLSCLLSQEQSPTVGSDMVLMACLGQGADPISLQSPGLFLECLVLGALQPRKRELLCRRKKA